MNLAGRSAHNFSSSINSNTNRQGEFELRILCDAAYFAHNDVGPTTTSIQSRHNPFTRMRPECDSPSSMSTPSFDASKQQEAQQHMSPHQEAIHPSKPYEQSQPSVTAGSEAVVVQPSFDDGNNDAVDHKREGAGNGIEWQQRSPTGDKGSSSAEDMRSSAPAVDEASAPHHGGHERRGGHRRDLSAHFFEATTISEEATVPTSTDESPSSPGAGNKHRRVFSGDVSNPAQAHRRINSIGTSATIKRRSYGGGQHHQRVDSAGLDVLTAAADVSREELAAAAGHRPRGSTPSGPWEPPQAPGGAPSSSRRSPVEMTSYDYSTMNAPPPRPRHSYPPATSGPHAPTGPYVSSQVGPHMGPPPPPSYAQPTYPPYYAPPPPHAHGYRGYPPPPPPHAMGYPVQYSRGGHEQYMKQPAPLGPPPQQPGSEKSRRDPSPRASTDETVEERNSAEEKRFRGEGHPMTPPPPVMPSSHWRGQGTHQGVQTFVTAIGVGEGSRTMHPSAAAYHRNTSITGELGDRGSLSSAPGHHRKLSSFSSIANIFQGPTAGEVAEQHPLKGGHHRATSSTVSFLRDLDVGLESSDAAFLQNLQASNAVGAAKDVVSRSNAADNDDSEADGAGSKLAPGGTSKRVRRKCTIDGCPNRVVQGGLCIAHGAKRKTCKHPGCNKNVKKAGLCSTHGPARKRCEADGCSKVAVQGGRCIAHGAKKKLCSIDGCAKQAILSGMCKKHHDLHRASNGDGGGSPGSATQCKPVGTAKTSGPKSGAQHKKGHTRGLSIFQDLSADAVGSLLADEGMEEGAPPSDRGYSQEYGSY